MRILLLSAANSIHTVRWVNTLAGRGYEVHLAYNAEHLPTSNIINERVIQHKLKQKGFLAYYLNAVQLAKLFQEICPDVVNAHYASGYGTLARIAKLKPLILSVWGSDVYDFPYQGKLKMKILRKNIIYADKIASTSCSMANQVEKLMNNYNMDITVTPFGVDINLFKPMDIKKEEFVFGVVKTLSKKYGIEYIIKGFKILLDRLKNEELSSNPILEIYGSGIMIEELKSLCEELNISDRVFFKGYIPNTEVPYAINKMDIFCLGSVSDSESFGVAAVEAMACEVPVIATDVSGFKEVLIDGESGYIIPRENGQVMAEKMYELILDEGLRKRLGKNGRKRVLKLYDWEKNVDLMEVLYNDVKVK
jgi:glycosyltransferase involved in cell wall biosynthesis